jgi:hypothetical protein
MMLAKMQTLVWESQNSVTQMLAAPDGPAWYMLLMCNQNLNYIFYLEFSVHVLMAKQDVATEETVFVICMVGCAMIHAMVYKDLYWFATCISYLA